MTKPRSPLLPPRCQRCLWTRRLLALVLLTALAAALLPVRPGRAAGADAASAPTAVPASAATPASAAAKPATAELIYTRIQLVQLQVKQPWKGLQLVRPGPAPFELQFEPEQLPPDMAISAAGLLSGTPSAAGDFPFVLRLKEGARTVEQRYLIRVRGPKPAASKAPITTLPAHSAALKPDLPPEVPRVWMLSADDIATLALPTEEEALHAKQAEEAGLPVPVPTPDQIKAILDPLQDQEFPTEALLRHALQAKVCTYFKAHVRAVREQMQPRRDIDDTCPPRNGSLEAEGRLAVPALHPAASRRAVALLRDARELAAKGSVPAVPASAAAAVNPAPGASASASAARKAAPRSNPSQVALVDFYDQLLTAERARAIVTQAEKARPLAKATPVALAASGGCRCRPVDTSDDAMGLLAHWHGGAQAQKVDFSLFSRLTWLGGVLEDNGAVRLAEPHGAPQPLAFVRAARQYGVQVDLGVHRRDWGLLRGASDKKVDELAASAASQTWTQLQTPLADRTAWWQRFLLPVWRDADWAFEGLTVFFEDTTEFEEPALRERFQRFLYAYVREVMKQMRRGAVASAPASGASGPQTASVARADRPYRLSLVVPDHLVLADGVFGLDRLWQVFQDSERVLNDAQIRDRRLSLVQDRGSLRPVDTDITVNFLVLLSDPTSDFKKLLRARLDDSRNIKGHDRVALLHSMVPVLLTRRDTKLPLGEDKDQLSDDFAYARWNYGGVGLWPMPVEGVGQGSAVNSLMGKTYGAAPSWSDGLCQWACPWRVPLRLAMQGLVLVGAFVLSLYLWNCRVRALGKPVELFMLAGGLITFMVGGALLTCDPLLQQLEISSLLLAGGILGALAFGLWRTLRPPE